MSAIGDISELSSASLLWQLQLGNAGAQPTASQKEQAQSQIQSFAQQAGYDATSIANIQGDIRTAIEEVQSGNVENPQAYIQNAVQESFSANGINAEQFKADLSSILESLGIQPGQAGGIQGSYDTASAQNDLLNQLFGDSDSEDGEESDSGQTSLSELLSLLNSNLPAGTLVDYQA
ncbi:MAG: hypothetical protein AAGB48_09750 [Planctomycetota bacterium]